MASKLWKTWTQGDKRNAEPAYRTGGLTPIESGGHSLPESRKPDKSSNPAGIVRRQKPPNLEVPNSRRDPFGNVVTPASIVLHDAVLSICAVVNDQLRSPSRTNLSRPSVDKPLPGRPRSLTAPSSPAQGQPAIAELPGSLLLENQGFPKGVVVVEDVDADSGVGSSGPFPSITVERPRTAHLADRKQTFIQHRKSMSVNDLSCKSKPARSSTPSAEPWHPEALESPSSNQMVGRKTSLKGIAPDMEQLERPLEDSPTIGSSKSPRSDRKGKTPALVTLDVNNSKSPSQPTEADELRARIAAQQQSIAALTTQCNVLREQRDSHDSHISALKDLHGKEVASLKTYITVIEQQNRSLNENLQAMQEKSSFEREQTPQSRTAGNSAGSSAKSYQGFFDKQAAKASNNDVAASQAQPNNDDVQKLHRQLEETETAIRTQQRHDVVLDEKIQKLLADKQTMELQEDELKKENQGLQKIIWTLQSYLTNVSASRLESMERTRDLEVKLKQSRESNEAATAADTTAMRKAYDELSRKYEKLEGQSNKAQQKLREGRCRIEHLETQVTQAEATQKKDSNLQIIFSLNQQLKAVQRTAREREQQAQDMQQQNEGLRADMEQVRSRSEELRRQNEKLEHTRETQARALTAQKVNSAQIQVYQAQIATLEARLNEAQVRAEHAFRTLAAEREQIASLLPGSSGDQLRGSILASSSLSDMLKSCPALSRLSVATSHSAPSSSRTSAFGSDSQPEAKSRKIARIRAKAHQALAGEGVYQAEMDPLRRIEQLELEIAYHLEDILLYRVDVAGYRKDLKQLRKEYEELQERTKRMDRENSVDSAQQSESPMPIDNSSSSKSESRRPRKLSGLGIITAAVGDLPLDSPTLAVSPLRTAGPKSAGNQTSSPQEELKTPSTPQKKLPGLPERPHPKRKDSAPSLRQGAASSPVSLDGESFPAPKTPSRGIARSNRPTYPRKLSSPIISSIMDEISTGSPRPKGADPADGIETSGLGLWQPPNATSKSPESSHSSWPVTPARPNASPYESPVATPSPRTQHPGFFDATAGRTLAPNGSSKANTLNAKSPQLSPPASATTVLPLRSRCESPRSPYMSPPGGSSTTVASTATTEPSSFESVTSASSSPTSAAGAGAKASTATAADKRTPNLRPATPDCAESPEPRPSPRPSAERRSLSESIISAYGAGAGASTPSPRHSGSSAGSPAAEGRGPGLAAARGSEAEAEAGAEAEAARDAAGRDGGPGPAGAAGQATGPPAAGRLRSESSPAPLAPRQRHLAPPGPAGPAAPAPQQRARQSPFPLHAVQAQAQAPPQQQPQVLLLGEGTSRQLLSPPQQPPSAHQQSQSQPQLQSQSQQQQQQPAAQQSPRRPLHLSPRPQTPTTALQLPRSPHTLCPEQAQAQSPAQPRSPVPLPAATLARARLVHNRSPSAGGGGAGGGGRREEEAAPLQARAHAGAERGGEASGGVADAGAGAGAADGAGADREGAAGGGGRGRAWEAQRKRERRGEEMPRWDPFAGPAPCKESEAWAQRLRAGEASE
ncbi:hypothetical protein BDY21DRAFT_370238 [Lineolata rhizophorae]|uniref:Uncharacterized protein n=1 Tax=Lineolata rhizophorae TaxID=578093 RepID=A0A6A6P687_9PEZI|nr:hypothetical protein BDY21DRAFT_370238 [Lineolata rhizophorae]